MVVIYVSNKIAADFAVLIDFGGAIIITGVQQTFCARERRHPNIVNPIRLSHTLSVNKLDERLSATASAKVPQRDAETNGARVRAAY